MWEFLIGFALGVYFWRSLILNSVTCVNLMDDEDAQFDKESWNKDEGQRQMAKLLERNGC